MCVGVSVGVVVSTMGTANCIWSVIQSQSPISIALVSIQWNVAQDT